MQDGWNITGDTYIRDAEGYLWYQGRSDDMIVSAGYNIGPAEIELALELHPDVAECAVVGKPDPDRGMIVHAAVVLADGADAGDPEGRRAAGLHKAADGAVQVPAVRRIRRDTAQDGDREGAAVPAAQLTAAGGLWPGAGNRG